MTRLFIIVSAVVGIAIVFTTLYQHASLSVDNKITADPTVFQHFQKAFSISVPRSDAPYHMLFTGDVFLGRAVERSWLYNDIDPFIYIKDFLLQFDAVIANFESGVPEQHVPTPNYTFQFSVPERFLPSMYDANIQFVSLANNHTYDHGREGFLETQAAMRNHGINMFGHPRAIGTSSIQYLTAADTAISIVGLNTVGVPVDMDAITRTLQRMATTSDVQIVYIHWGDEYEHHPNQQQTSLSALFAQAGVDLVIGHHPHVVQSITQEDSTIIINSLGNFVFDQYFSEAVQTGLLAGIIVSEEEVSLELYPVSSLSHKHQPSLLQMEEKASFLKALAAISEPKLEQYIESGVIPLAVTP